MEIRSILIHLYLFLIITILSVDDNVLEFKSYSECDRYFNMWRGYTSELANKKSEQLIVNKYKFELI